MLQTKLGNSKSKKLTHFILAVDPFVDAKFQVNIFRLAKIIQQKTGCTIEPVFVLGASGRGFMLSKKDLQYWLPQTKTALSKLIGKFKLVEFNPTKILIQKTPFLRMDVKALVSYAKSRKASAILISTQLKNAFEREVLGSFAETLMLYSAVPVIAVPPKITLKKTLTPILFPTDFGRESSEAYGHCISLAKILSSKIILFHEHTSPHFVYPEGVLKKEHKKWKKMCESDEMYLKKMTLLEQWKQKAAKSGVECETKITMETANIADVILSESKSGKYGLIAMAATKGPDKAWFTGSTPRWVLRHSLFPVWVFYNSSRS